MIRPIIYASLLLTVGGLRVSQAQAPVKLGHETTRISAPLADDGLPNYSLAILEQQRAGATPENNGAILFWSYVEPSDPNDAYFYNLEEEFGVQTGLGSLKNIFEGRSHAMLNTWLKKGNGAVHQNEPDKWLDAAIERPWKESDIPPLAEWLEDHSEAIENVIDATAKPRFYSPSPNLLEKPQLAVSDLELPHGTAAMHAARILCIRANLLTASRQYTQAWRHCLACWRLGDQIAQGPTLIDQFVASAIHSLAMRATLVLLQTDDMPAKGALKILSDLDALSPSIGMANALDGMERYLLLDLALREATGRLGGPPESWEYSQAAQKVLPAKVEPALQHINQWFDRAVSAAKMEDPVARRKTVAGLTSELKAASQAIVTKAKSGEIKETDRAALFGGLIVATSFPSIELAVNAVDEDLANLQLTRIAAALAAHRANAGKYPESLEALSPKPFASLPLDPFTGRSFVYRTIGDGYVLYSLYNNGVDDLGSDVRRSIKNGEWTMTSPPTPSEEADLAVRLPLPPLEQTIEQGASGP